MHSVAREMYREREKKVTRNEIENPPRLRLCARSHTRNVSRNVCALVSAVSRARASCLTCDSFICRRGNICPPPRRQTLSHATHKRRQKPQASTERALPFRLSASAHNMLARLEFRCALARARNICKSDSRTIWQIAHESIHSYTRGKDYANRASVEMDHLR